MDKLPHKGGILLQMEPPCLLIATKVWFEDLFDHYKVHVDLEWFQEPPEEWLRLLEIRTTLNDVHEYEVEDKGHRVDYRGIECKRTKLKFGTTSYEVDFEVAYHPSPLCFSAYVSSTSDGPAIMIYQGHPTSQLVWFSL